MELLYYTIFIICVNKINTSRRFFHVVTHVITSVISTGDTWETLFLKRMMWY
jgi:hypothetical protein